MSQCDNMLVSGSYGISLLQQLWGLLKYIIGCGSCSDSKMHFALQSLFAYYFGMFPWGVQAGTGMLIMNCLYIGQSFQKFLRMKRKYFFHSRGFFQIDLTWNCGKEWSCPSQRKASKTLYMEIISNGKFTRSSFPCCIFSLISVFKS